MTEKPIGYIKAAQFFITTLDSVLKKWEEKRRKDAAAWEHHAQFDPIAKDKVLLDAERKSPVPRVRKDVKPLVLKQEHPYYAAKIANDAYSWAVYVAVRKKSRKWRKHLAKVCGLAASFLALATAACVGCILLLLIVWWKYHILGQVTQQLQIVLVAGIFEAAMGAVFGYRITSRMYSSAELLRFR